MPVRARLVLVLLGLLPVARVAGAEVGSGPAEAARTCEAAATCTGEDGPAAVACARVYFDLVQLDPAEACARRAGELVPASAEPLAELARIHARRGDDARADELAARARRLDPSSPAAAEVLATTAARRALAAAPAASPAARDPAAPVVLALAAAAIDGEDPRASALDVLVPGVFVAARVDEARRVGRALRGLGGMRGVTVDAAPAAGDHAEVRARVLVAPRPDIGLAAGLARRLDAGGAVLLPAGVLATYRGLPPTERRGFLERVANLGAPTILSLRFGLVRDAAGWKIAELHLAADDGPEASLAALARGLPPPPGEPAAAGYVRAILGTLIALFVAGGLLALAVRMRRATAA